MEEDDIVKLNVGGYKFYTTKRTLLSHHALKAVEDIETPTRTSDNSSNNSAKQDNRSFFHALLSGQFKGLCSCQTRTHTRTRHDTPHAHAHATRTTHTDKHTDTHKHTRTQKHAFTQPRIARNHQCTHAYRKYVDSALFACVARKDDKGFIFIDRNGKYFEPILDYLRTGEWLCPAHLDEKTVLRVSNNNSTVATITTPTNKQLNIPNNKQQGINILVYLLHL